MLENVKETKRQRKYPNDLNASIEADNTIWPIVIQEA